MRKLIVSILTITLFLLISSTTISGYATITPQEQTIEGSSGTAYWTFSWGTGSNPWRVDFAADTDRSYVTIDRNTNSTVMTHQQYYSLGYGTNYDNYTPHLRVMDSNYIITGVDTATVYQNR
ncbi:hypothetical protein [Allobacillus halotolerans]|uniref:Uncharacterized protein n=1 Tax=Allobacillus halotolerans TaxID=570278 RepID=A0ABS6GRP9_9BACI|nr:hypothetical protein [Allobacillus halotolerans]MBU6081339.1 hypothetical protein [Allobacillus halotolerans]